MTELVSEYTTFYPSDFPPRLTNIHRAADLMDDTLVLPGKTFSMNKEVGERTGARGFAQGYVISGGKLQVDFGGGVSQLATTTFNAMFFAGLEDVEHHPHSFYISRYPEGREATVAWGVEGSAVPQRHRHRHLHHHGLHQQLGDGADVGDEDLHRRELEVGPLQRPSVPDRLQQEARGQQPW